MTFLSRLAFLGAAKETTNGTPVVPAFAIPFMKAQYETIYTPLRDETVRGNDSILQGLYQGPADSTWDIEFPFYPDIAGNFLRMLGTDTVTAAANNTTTTGTNSAGSTTLNTTAALTTGNVVQIDTGPNVEWASVTTGSTTSTLATPLRFTHAPGTAVVSQTTHTFAQSTSSRPPSYTLSVFDNVDYRAWPGCVATELQIKIDPKGMVTFNVKYVGFPEQTATTFTNTFNTVIPGLGWEWTVTNAGGTSTRGLTMDLTLKRAGEAIHTSNGLQPPRETFVGALELDGAYKAIYENTNDMNLFLNYTQTPTVHTITKPAVAGGESLAMTMSSSGYNKAVRELGQVYVQASFDVSAIQNTTDAGITKFVLKNFVTTQY